jgi:hypothetical protein
MPAMIRINQALQTAENCRYRTVTAVLCPTSEQEAKSMINQALGATEIPDYTVNTDELAVVTKASTTVPTYQQPSASLQSP